MNLRWAGLCVALAAGCDSLLVVGAAENDGSAASGGGAGEPTNGGADDGADAGAVSSGGSDARAGAPGAGGDVGAGGDAGIAGVGSGGDPSQAGAAGAPQADFCEGALAAKDVSAGEYHACAVTLEGEIYCWGVGQSGQLGNSDTIDTNYPVRVTSKLQFERVATLVTNTCALDDQDRLHCWGGNFDGVLADDSLVGTSSPVLVLEGVADFAANVASVIAVTNQEVLAWGSNTFGQLGLGAGSVGEAVHEVTPVGTAAVSATIGSTHACLLDGLGQVSCSGDNTYGQLGQTGGDRDTFGAVAGAVAFASLDAGHELSCGLDAGGSAYCFGRNADPQLIEDWPGVLTQPIQLGETSGYDAVSVGFWHVCLLRDQRIHCLGRNAYGEVGTEPSADVTTPFELPGGVAYSQVSAGREFTCAIRAADSIVVCFGRNDEGQLGRAGEASAVPSAVCIPP